MTGSKKYKILLVGSPNVGKSTIFYNLTGRYTNVSNYPGTTVTFTEGSAKIGEHHNLLVIDTPGIYNLHTITEEEEVAKKLILEGSPDVVIHIIDAKNIERMLPFTLQLIEAKIPTILVLNMIDELKKSNMDIQISHLEHDLGIPVVETIGIKNVGIKNLRARIISVAEKRYKFSPIHIKYPEYIEENISKISQLLHNKYTISKRAIALLAMSGDTFIYKLISNEKNFIEISEILKNVSPQKARLDIENTRFNYSSKLIKEHLLVKTKREEKWTKFIDTLTLNPISGLLLALLILYIGLYKFVGQFGASFLVDVLETFYEEHITIPINNFFHSLFNSNILFDLFAGDYGIFTLALRYALAIVLPIVAIFFSFFALLEDSGYLVRLSIMLDRFLKKIGLSGRSAIPLVLGLGCGTMATIVTRTLETIRERYMVTFLLALTIPCSAQLGVILALLGTSFTALSIWLITLICIFAIAGGLLNKALKGEQPVFFMEVPPLRMPSLKNVTLKTYERLRWYFVEVLPIFILASVLIWIGRITYIFDFLAYILSYPAKWAGLPAKVGEIFLYGFFRRDFGAAGLYDMRDILTIRQIIVASVVLTLFVPCVAQFLIMVKERGYKSATFIFLTVIPTAFIIGILLNLILTPFIQ
jgi:ferrous iron transport protein B